MLRSRIIPFLLIDKNTDTVKTIKFSNRNYVGDILNNIRIFNEKEVDEIVVLDIDISNLNYEPNYEIISKIASVCRMPLTYGGGIKNISVAKKIIKLGVEKICINSAAIKNINFLKLISNEIGSQSLSVCINVRKEGNKYSIFSNKLEFVNIDLIDYVTDLQLNGVGEIIFNLIDDDGSLNGYNFSFLETINDYINVPSIILGGCSNYENIKLLFRKFPKFASGCSSVFIYKGKFKAVLINYPSKNQKEYILNG